MADHRNPDHVRVDPVHGASLVHALVSDGQGGEVALKNRVQDDSSGAATIESWPPRP